MINSIATLYLLAFPVGLMGVVQMVFAGLSYSLFGDHETLQFAEPAGLMLLFFLLCVFLRGRFDVRRIGFRDALLFAALTWTLLGVLGAAPIALIAGVSLTDAVFESISALTTTGATILTGLDAMPRTFLMYRQFLQWLGGLGLVIFVVAVLPMLNVGGMKLLKAETPGPIKGDKLSPRIASTAHYLWLVYLAITVLCAFGYFFAGMSVYDAIAHSFTTVSTGGFSTHDSSMGYFHSQLILAVANVFMVLGAISFALHFRVWRGLRGSLYWRDEETRSFLWIILFLALLISAILMGQGYYHDPIDAFSNGLFHLISFITSTGYGADAFTEWPPVVLFLLVFASYLGGCAGSTAGGNKIIRNILTVKFIALEIKRLIHPKGVFFIKYQDRTVEESVISATMAFMTVAAATSMVVALMLMTTGLDFWSSLTAVSACINVLGPAFGELGSNFQPVSDAGTWILSGAMILGRLEYFSVVALVLPVFWRH